MLRPTPVELDLLLWSEASVSSRSTSVSLSHNAIASSALSDAGSLSSADTDVDGMTRSSHPWAAAARLPTAADCSEPPGGAGLADELVNRPQCSWFRVAPVGAILNVERPYAHHLYWPDIDVDWSVDSIEHP